MRQLAFALFLGITTVGCGGTVSDGYAVDLTIVTDSTVDVSKLATLTLNVSGADDYSSPSIAVAGKFTSGKATLRYVPGAKSGTLRFEVTAFDSSNTEVAEGSVDSVMLKPGATQTATITLSSEVPTQDLGVPDHGMPDLSRTGDMARLPDLQPEPDLCSPKTAADCDDGNPCTTDTVSDGSCDNTCVHTPEALAIACTSGASSGVCLGSTCCTGCIHNGVCEPGATDKTNCGKGGADCFDCTQNSASATCTAGTCSGCDSSSCGARVCGTSTCGYNCGSCSDQCISGGTLNHYVCGSGGTCAQNGGTNCGLYLNCASGSACATTCSTDTDCVATAFCNSSNKCVTKAALGGACTAEGTAHDHECQSGLHCTWYSSDDTTLSAVCAHNTCSACQVIVASDWTTCQLAMPYQQDPRHYCVGTDTCHQAFCGNGTNGCDNGTTSFGDPRPCGTTSCTNSDDGNGNSWGTVTGSLCVPSGGTTKCLASQSTMCGGTEYVCPCAGTICSYDFDICAEKHG